MKKKISQIPIIKSGRRKLCLWSLVVWTLACIVSFASCSGSVPEKYEEKKDEPTIYPDYKNITVPVNIAPLNFEVKDDADEVIVRLTYLDGKEMVIKGEGGDIKFPEKEWKEMLSKTVECDDKAVRADVYLRREKQWFHCLPFTISVSPDSIDPYMTCRLIPPSYELTGDIGLYEYGLEKHTVRKFVGNKRYGDDINYRGHLCMNCHTTQASNPNNTVFHYRAKGGGMIVRYNGELKKVSTKVGDMAAAAVYERWHPYLPLIAFSNNTVRQSFPTNTNVKIEVFDLRSDLLLYDVEMDTIAYILKTHESTETYPEWSPDGKYLYYCTTDSVYVQKMLGYTNMRYDLMRIPFDEKTYAFGKPELMYNATDEGKSISKPRISPDGKFLVMTISSYGTYHYTHKDADVLLMDLQTRQVRNLAEVNTDNVEGYVSWSSNGKWLMISSCRDDGNYARVYFSHFDDGKATKPFQLPHKSPLYDHYLMEVYNYPEFAKKSVETTEMEIYHLLEDAEPVVPLYKGEIDANMTDATAGASIVRGESGD